MKFGENYGEHLGFKDDEYKAQGVTIINDEKILESADIIIQMGLLDENKTSALKANQFYWSS